MSGYKKKLIEVALPLEAINKESIREKAIKHGHPSTLHLWWARRPLAACRAVLFASLVDDPSSHLDRFPTEDAQKKERERLFKIIEELVVWENARNEDVLERVHKEILRSTNGNPPPFLDPFCGGGSIPFEAQRLGLKTYASDLNPVAVLITKALIEIPPKFTGKPPVNPETRKNPVFYTKEWKGAQGLAEDVRYYGKWMREEAFRRIGHLYPKVKLPKEHGGGEATVIAWLWARTVKCPNPACGTIIPLVRSFWLSTKAKKKEWLEPVLKGKKIHFEVKSGKGEPPPATKTARGAKFRCIACHQDAPESHIKSEGREGRMGSQLLAVVAEGKNRRIYVSPTEEHELQDLPNAISAPNQSLAYDPRAIWCVNYGLDTFDKLFTKRQLITLTTFTNLVKEVIERVEADTLLSEISNNTIPLREGGNGSKAYAEAVGIYLALGVSRLTNRSSTICFWDNLGEKIQQVFARQAIPMTWDYVEGNPFSNSTGNFIGQLDYLTHVIEMNQIKAKGTSEQSDSAHQLLLPEEKVLISTDPPYYDNVGYADLSDFFYVWLRTSLGNIYPELFSTMLAPKGPELVAIPYRFEGSRKKAEEHFLTGISKAFKNMREKAHKNYPLTIYYAFKQREEDQDEEGERSGTSASTGWETMLESLINAGFQIVGTWPMRTELIGSLKKNVNALASSIVLVCRPRPDNAPVTTRRELTGTLRRELPDALKKLQEGYIAPVDFAQAAIGPGMAVFSRYSKVLEADGSPMSVRSALQIINQELDTYFAEQEGEFDPDTKFSIAWFEQYGIGEGPFGEADVLARAKNTSVDGVVKAGVLVAKGGKVRLMKREEYPDDWDPDEDKRLVIWECTQYLIKALERGGEKEAARLYQKLGGARSEEARALAYRLYAICDRKKWAQEALAYNMLASSWSDVQSTASHLDVSYEQMELPGLRG